MTLFHPTFKFENEFSLKGELVAGIDEAGCGPWAGPVVAAAVIIDQDLFDDELRAGVKDSKKLVRSKRESACEKLIAHPSIQYGVGEASVQEIDQLNIGKATRLAMVRAVLNLKTQPTFVLVDGIRAPVLKQRVQTIIKGDQQSFSIAAASIIAKVTRDKIMDILDKEHPSYGWKRNAGYGTKIHHEAMKLYGLTQHHRLSYAPVKALLEKVS
ncbi:MAG: ribonuclease HII [Alphaproteobacteria bacterium]|nr:ribonuclease HII [Alphaproteobacteria bacterium]